MTTRATNGGKAAVTAETMSVATRALYSAVQTRPRPEDVAEIIESVLPLAAGELAVIAKASRYSFKKMAYGYSSMASDFLRPASAEKQVGSVARLFEVAPLSAADCLVPDRVIAFVNEVGARIGKVYGDARHLNKAERRAMGLFKVQRWYNKRWRALKHLEEKIARLAWNVKKYEFTRVGKSALATSISFEDLSANLTTACFVAYLSAKMSSRSVFTNASQERPFDEVAAMLLKKCERDPETRWDVVARVWPEPKVLTRLGDEEKGKLLGAWWALLTGMADMLRVVWEKDRFDRLKMIVARGNDSSTWNQVALGWNRAREHWVSLVHALGMESLLDEVCPGKVMRLMAADVARWHIASGGDVHPDTAVWAELPPPWEVVRGETRCGRALVEERCRAHDVKPEAWTGGKQSPQRAASFKPTPELVHGVAVASADLAMLLRKAGAFSGKTVKGDMPDVEVARDEHGFALHAGPVTPTESFGLHGTRSCVE